MRSRDLEVTAPLTEAVTRSFVVAHVPPLEAGSRPAHVLVGSESDLPPAFLADPWQAGREIAGPTLRLVVVTRGERGAEAFGATERESVPAPRVTGSAGPASPARLSAEPGPRRAGGGSGPLRQRTAEGLRRGYNHRGEGRA